MLKRFTWIYSLWKEKKTQIINIIFFLHISINSSGYFPKCVHCTLHESIYAACNYSAGFVVLYLHGLWMQLIGITNFFFDQYVNISAQAYSIAHKSETKQILGIRKVLSLYFSIIHFSPDRTKTTKNERRSMFMFPVDDEPMGWIQQTAEHQKMLSVL